MFARPARVTLSTLLYKLRYKSRSVLHNGTWDRKIEKKPGNSDLPFAAAVGIPTTARVHTAQNLNVPFSSNLINNIFSSFYLAFTAFLQPIRNFWLFRHKEVFLKTVIS